MYIYIYQLFAELPLRRNGLHLQSARHWAWIQHCGAVECTQTPGSSKYKVRVERWDSANAPPRHLPGIQSSRCKSGCLDFSSEFTNAIWGFGKCTDCGRHIFGAYLPSPERCHRYLCKNVPHQKQADHLLDLLWTGSTVPPIQMIYMT